MARRNPAPRDTKDRILAAALEVFGDRGYHAASVDEICARAGVTKGALYYYFEDKDDLARDLQQRLWERLKAQALEVFDPAHDTLTNLERGLEAFLGALQGLGPARFFLRDGWAIPALDIAARGELDTSLELLRSMLEDGVARGELIPLDPEAMAHVLLGAYAEATLHILTTGRVDETVSVIRHVVRALARRPVSARHKQGVR